MKLWKREISADLPSRAEGPAFLFSSASITSSADIKHIVILVQQFIQQVDLPSGTLRPTCPVDPGPVAVQLSLNLLLASQLHESPAVLHPLPFFSKLPEPQMTTSLDSESSMRIYVHITQVFLLEAQPEERILLLIVHSAVRAEKRREEKRREMNKVWSLIARDNENQSPISLSQELITV